MTRKGRPGEPAIDQRICDALTELHTYVLVLGADLQRIEARSRELHDAGEAFDELGELRRHVAEIGAQREFLERLIDALRDSADPARRYL